MLQSACRRAAIAVEALARSRITSVDLHVQGRVDYAWIFLETMSSTRKRPLVSSGSQVPGKKRKTDPAMQKFYAVRIGMRPGVYRTWEECQAQTAGFKGASCRSIPRERRERGERRSLGQLC
jgi:hypothetical protein